MNEVEEWPTLTPCIETKLQHMLFTIQSVYFYQVSRKFPGNQTNLNPMIFPPHFKGEPWDVIQSLEPFVSCVIPNTNQRQHNMIGIYNISIILSELQVQL